jgi:hypothetical protein
MKEIQKVYMIFLLSRTLKNRFFTEHYHLQNENIVEKNWNFLKIHVKNTSFLSRKQSSISFDVNNCNPPLFIRIYNLNRKKNLMLLTSGKLLP